MRPGWYLIRQAAPMKDPHFMKMGFYNYAYVTVNNRDPDNHLPLNLQKGIISKLKTIMISWFITALLADAPISWSGFIPLNTLNNTR